MRTKTHREVVKDLAMLAQVNQEVYYEDQLFFVQKLALLDQMLDVILHSHSCAMH